MCLLSIRKLDLKEGIKLIYISLILDQTFFCVERDCGRVRGLCWRCEGKVDLDFFETYTLVANTAVK